MSDPAPNWFRWLRQAVFLLLALVLAAWLLYRAHPLLDNLPFLR